MARMAGLLWPAAFRGGLTMDEVKKRRYPRDLEKLKELAERLEYEIADRQEMLADVRRLKTEAENAEIVNTVKK